MDSVIIQEGDTVRRKDGNPFSNGNMQVTVGGFTKSFMNPDEWRAWFIETGTHESTEELELVSLGPNHSINDALKFKVMSEPAPEPDTAGDLLARAGELIGQRGKSRDASGSERSMARTVRAFNAMTGHELTEEEGWMFMRYLKDSRARKGEFNRDDFEDGVAYAALQAEAAIQENDE